MGYSHSEPLQQTALHASCLGVQLWALIRRGGEGMIVASILCQGH